MAKKNELLEKDIQDRLEDLKYEKPEKTKNRQSIFYIMVVILVTLSVIMSLLRYLM